MTRTRKKKIVYTKTDPLEVDWVNYIAIQTETNPPYVFATYGGFRGINDVPQHVRGLAEMLVVSVEQARRLFNFKKVRDLSVCVSA